MSESSLQGRSGAASGRPGYVFVLPWNLDYGGGVNQVVANLFREMAAEGEYEPIVLVTHWADFRPREEMIEGRRTIYLRLWPPWSENGSISGFLKWLLASPVWGYDLLKLCRRHRVKAFNFHFPGISAYPIALLRWLGLFRGALVISFHGADLREIRKGEGRPIEQGMWRFILRSASAIVACSRDFASDVRAFAGKYADKVGAIQNGLDLDHFLSQVDRDAAGPPSMGGRDVLVSVATWEHKKGLDILLLAFARVLESRPDTILVMIGRASDAEHELRNLAAELGIAANVLFVPNLPHAQVGRYLEIAKLFCLPSRVEPFGIAILEAGAYRLPVVASRVGGIPEIIEDGESGRLVDPENVAALAGAILEVLNDDALAARLARNLHERVIQDFSWRRAYQGYRALIANP